MILPFNAVGAGPRADSVSTLPAREMYAHSRLKSWTTKLSDTWFALQITHFGGKYSIERMLALEEYTRNTSLSRILLVVVCTPLPTIILVLCQESIPLQDPSDGWSTNYGFWFRMGTLAVGEACATIIQVAFLLDGIDLSLRQIVLLCVCVGISHTAAAMLIAAYWVFPIPFASFTLSMILFAFFVVMFRILVGGQVLRHILSQREQLRQCAKFFTVQMFMVIVYPSYQVLFEAVNQTNYELPVLLLLPALKLVLKNISTFTILHKEDTVPEQVIFTVDFFDAFYLAMCMKNVTSMTTVIAIMAVDLAQTALEMQELYQRTQGVLERLNRALGMNNNQNLLAAVRTLCETCNFDIQQKKTTTCFRVRSCIFHKLSQEGEKILENLKICSFKPSSQESTRRLSMSARISRWKRGVVRIQPKIDLAPGNVEPVTVTSKVLRRSRQMNDNVNILRETLEVLFTNECLVLTEYLETIVPILYANFVLVMVHFPSVQYHSEMLGATPENVGSTIQNVLVYALLELASFVVLAVIMWRNCGIHALYQLAFVLETQWTFIQPKLVLWVLTTLTYSVTHFGVDFSFRFDWIRDTTST